MKKEYKNYLILTITVLLVVLICTRGYNLFGSDTDWVNQHTIIPEYFREIFYKTGNLFPNFSFHYGAGQNIFNISYYGLLSPIVLLSYLFPHINMVTYITIIDIIILIISSFLFYRWIKSHNTSNIVSLTSSLIFVLAEPFIFQMHRHIMFVNYMPFLIMALIGVDRYINNKEKSLLLIGVFLMIMTSYYYSVCGLLVICIYYLYTYLNKYETLSTSKLFIDGIKFVLVLFLAILSSSILLLPTMYTLIFGRAEGGSTYNLISLLIPTLKVHKLFSGTYTIGFAIIGLISLLYLFYTKKKNNIILGTILLIILLLPIFRYALNGGLYLREKCFIPFIPLFGFLISNFLKDLYDDKININKFLIFTSIIIIFLYLINKFNYFYYYYFIFLIIILIYKKYKNKIIPSILLVLLALTISVVSNLTEEYVSYDMYNNFFDKEMLSSINNILEKDKSIYRTNNLIYPTKNVNNIVNNRYYTTNIYSSTYNSNYLNFIRNTFQTSMLEYNYFLVSASSNFMFNSYMGVKYLISNYDPGLGYEKINNNTYLNNNAYSIMYASNHILNEDEFDKYTYPYQLELLLNNVITKDKTTNANTYTSIKSYLPKYTIISKENVDITKENDKYILKVDNKTANIKIKLEQPLHNKFLLINLYGLKENSCSYDNISMTINNIENILTCKTWPYSNKNNTFKYVIGDRTIEYLDIKLTKGTYNIDKIELYTLDYDSIKNTKSNTTEVTINKMENDTIIASAKVNSPSYIVASIPYDKGFTVKVDDKKIPYEKINKAFIGFKVDKGTHTIKITYSSPWHKEGKIISCISIISTIVILTIDKTKKKKQFNKIAS